MMGDYYAAGDPGIFGFLGGAIKKIAGVGLGVAKTVLGGTPVGMAVTGITSAMMPTQNIPTFISPPAMRGIQPATAPRGVAAQQGQAEQTQRPRNVIIGGKRWHYNKYGELKKGRIPIMNSLNPRALARSSRRIDGMRKGMGRALKHTNYKLVSKSAGRSRGSKGIITRSEAARALRG
jgi:hypothetical protein